jgi:hypothetical protein
LWENSGQEDSLVAIVRSKATSWIVVAEEFSIDRSDEVSTEGGGEVLMVSTVRNRLGSNVMSHGRSSRGVDCK